MTSSCFPLVGNYNRLKTGKKLIMYFFGFGNKKIKIAGGLVKAVATQFFFFYFCFPKDTSCKPLSIGDLIS